MHSAYRFRLHIWACVVVLVLLADAAEYAAGALWPLALHLPAMSVVTLDCRPQTLQADARMNDGHAMHALKVCRKAEVKFPITWLA